ncbi:MAG: N-acetylglucosamine kinase [Microscillaceae bacterium]|jgi:N-acetylglucosamine kinase-like BadF-type ATPase|nr:N-acetylglucosamine kinase [Microscillaceae bacterium]
MVLIADSGATKTDWRLIKNAEHIEAYATAGISPYYQNTDQIKQMLESQLLSQNIDNQGVTNIYYYGTGCSVPDKIAVVHSAISQVFPQAQVEVTHDLLASARALCGHQAGIACILGTGANACFYDGEKIASEENSLGFILGDEGAGAYLGKQLIISYLHKNLPETIYQQFKTTYPQVNRAEVLDRVYKQPYPSRYLASFARFIADHIQEPYFQNLVFKSFIDFLDKYVMVLPDYQQYPAHFTGSVAYHFQAILQKALQTKKITIGNVLETPIQGLINYHLQ